MPVHLADILRRAGRDAPDRGLTFVGDGSPQRITYAELLTSARSLAPILGRFSGQTVMIDLPTGPDFVVALFALSMAGAVPFAVAPPSRTGAEGWMRAESLAASARVRAVVTVAERASEWAKRNIQPIAFEQATDGPYHAAVPREDRATALVQATSGTCGPPKPVRLSHENVLTNLWQLGYGLRVTRRDVIVSWLPLFHDMGMIGGLLASVYWCVDAVFLSPFAFLRRPLRWLETIAEYRGTISPAPTFAYRRLAERLSDEEIERLDLSCWRAALCGAEPVSAAVLERFADRLRGAGFHPHAFVPCYGMAEATLGLTFHTPGRPLRIEVLDLVALARGRAQSARDLGRAVRLVSCGRPLEGVRVRIAGTTGDGQVGRIHVRGRSVMSGYVGGWRKTESTAWFDTGDVGYLRGGELFVVGRADELIDTRLGAFPPHEIEVAVEHALGEAGRSFVAVDGGGYHDLRVLCELAPRAKGRARDLVRAVEAAVRARTGLASVSVAFVPRLPKTTSGKPRRLAAGAENVQRPPPAPALRRASRTVSTHRLRRHTPSARSA